MLRPLFPEWAPRLPPSPEALADPGASRHRLFRALNELLDLIEVGVLVVEDAHWADDATLDCLLYCASRRSCRTTLVRTHRPEDTPPRSALMRLRSHAPAGTAAVRIALAALNVAETAVLMSSMLAGEPVSTTFATFLRDRTDSVPLAVEESVRLLRDRADLVRRGSEWVRRTLADIVVPPTIRDAVAERVTRLEADARRMVQAAAVLAEPMAVPGLATVCGLPEAAAAAAAAAADCSPRTAPAG